MLNTKGKHFIREAKYKEINNVPDASNGELAFAVIMVLITVGLAVFYGMVWGM